jgi:electron transfer flavoprotein-quinone oxidoreductase
MRKTNNKKAYDVILSGAGPAGLSAAILCAKKGLSVIVCEKGTVPGPLPRAETVYDHPVFDHVLGKGFIPRIGLYKTSKRKFNSPGAKKSLYIQLSGGRESFVFEWRDLIHALEQKAKSVGVQIRTSAEVVAPIIENDTCIGVMLQNNERIFARTVLACDGHASKLGRFAGVPYEQMNTVIVKNIVTNFQSDYDGFEYFFVGAGELPYAREFPALIAFVFPRGNNASETGLYMPPGPACKHGIIPSCVDEKRFLEIWRQLKTSYPRLSSLMHPTKNIYEGVAKIPVGRLHQNAAPVPGLILIGDAIGFLEASGVSGIITAMENARFAAEFIARFRNAPWSKWLSDAYNREFSRNTTFRMVKKRYAMTGIFNDIVFSKLKTAERINRHWWFIKLAFKFK